jgi:hypothetical protein
MVVKNGRHLKASSRVIGLAGIKEDLNIVCDLCLSANGLMNGDPATVRLMSKERLTALHGFYVAAFVTYARCFNGGRRTRLAEHHVRLGAGDDAEQAVRTHRLFLSIRDRHIAHSVNSHEDGILGIVVEGEPTRFAHLTWSLFRMSVGPENFHALWSLADVLLPVVNDMIDKAASAAIAEAETLTSEQLDGLPDAEYFPPSIDDDGRVRGGNEPPKGGDAWGVVLRAKLRTDAREDTGDGPDRNRARLTTEGPHSRPDIS